MNSPESNDEESLEERLARADREIRRAQLEARIRELGGVLPPRERPSYRRDHRLPVRD